MLCSYSIAHSVLLPLLLLLGQGTHCEIELQIYNTSDLIDFSNNVNSGTSYKGATVFLEADIDFSSDPSEQFESVNGFKEHLMGKAT